MGTAVKESAWKILHDVYMVDQFAFNFENSAIFFEEYTGN